MSEARTDTTKARPQGANAIQAAGGGSGRHRGGASSTENSTAPSHGRHRRPGGAKQ
ncbi:hypothetical protein [Streptomyces sp. NPDC059909]|uniref:hypothetical protein n=1 Tax=Streptomyces sp. NPDC059909 TaxID=3346998 RepID=UPI00365C0CD9